jgi:hypothetical protein
MSTRSFKSRKKIDQSLGSQDNLIPPLRLMNGKPFIWHRGKNIKKRIEGSDTVRDDTVRDGQPSPHRPRLVVSRSTCPPISPPPHVNSFVLGPVVINTHTHTRPRLAYTLLCRGY